MGRNNLAPKKTTSFKGRDTAVNWQERFKGRATKALSFTMASNPRGYENLMERSAVSFRLRASMVNASRQVAERSLITNLPPSLARRRQAGPIAKQRKG